MDHRERDKRFADLRRAMTENDIEVLLIAGKGHGWTGRGYFRYLTDFHLWGHDGIVLFPLEGEPMVSLTSAGVAAKVGERGWISDCRGDWDVFPTIVDELNRRRLDGARIGLVGRQMILPVGVYEGLVDGLPGAEFVNADVLMDSIRAVKSPVEISQIEDLWRMASEAMEVFVEELKPGMTQLQASAEPIRFLYERGARDHLVFIDGAIPTRRELSLDGILRYHMEICGPSGHWCEITVQPCFGALPEEARYLMEVELLAYEEVRKIARPRSTLNDLVRTYESVLRDTGFEIDKAQAGHHYDMHGQGLDWIEWPNRAPNDPHRFDTELVAGMYINYHPSRALIPAISSSGINDGLLVTAGGGRRIYPDWDMRHRPM